MSVVGLYCIGTKSGGGYVTHLPALDEVRARIYNESSFLQTAARVILQGSWYAGRGAISQASRLIAVSDHANSGEPDFERGEGGSSEAVSEISVGLIRGGR